MESNTATAAPAAREHAPLVIDEAALRAATDDLDDGPVTPSLMPWRDDIVKLLNDALATELVCVLRYRRHHFTAKGLASPAIAEEFLVHANEELAHADKIAERINELGAEPDFAPAGLTERSHADYDESSDLKDMIRANLKAERIAVESYRQMIKLVEGKDPTTQRMLEEILTDEEEHADELRGWLE
ncbi:MAG: ferritin-like domain-containing protein [Variovorax sp.]